MSVSSGRGVCGTVLYGSLLMSLAALLKLVWLVLRLLHAIYFLARADLRPLSLADRD